MAQRTISVPQRAGALSTPIVYEALARIVSGINMALTQSVLPSAPVPVSGLIAPTNPIVRLTTAGTVRTIGPVDFSSPLYLIASNGDVVLETGGNIGSAYTIPDQHVGALVPDANTGLWWPVGSALTSSSLVVKEADGSPSVASVGTIEFAGAVVSEPSAGVARVTVSTAATLVVKESDGSPSVASVGTIEFAGAVVSSPLAGTALVTVSASGGGDFLVMQVFS